MVPTARMPAARAASRALILCGGLTAVLVAAEGRVAGGSDSPPPPRRYFDAERRLFISQATPAFELPIPDPFRYLGRLEFALAERARVDRHLFARVDDGRIERLVVLQFEGLLDGVEGGYSFGIPAGDEIAGSNYRFTPERVEIGRHGWVHNSWAFDHEASAEAEPGRESDRTERFLETLGLELDAELVMSRFVREVGERARDELILFYMMPLAAAGHSLSDFPEGGPPTEAYDRLSERVTRESLELFSRLVDDG